MPVLGGATVDVRCFFRHGPDVQESLPRRRRGWSLPALLSLFPVFVLSGWWFALHHRRGVSLIGGFALVFAMYSMFFAYKGIYLHRSREDTAFLREVRRQVPLDQPLMINSADE